MRFSFPVFSLLRAVFYSLALFACGGAKAGTTWDGGGANSSWGTLANWNPNGLPLFNGTETITIGTGFTSGTTLTLDGNRYINHLLINTLTAFTISAGTGGTLNLRSGNLTRQDVAGTEAIQTISAGMVLGDPTGVAAYTGIWDIAGSNSLNVSGAISETGGVRGLTKTGIGTVILSGTNTFSGGLILNAGTVSISSDANLGASSGNLIFGGGTLQFTDNVVGSRAIIMTGDGVFSGTFGKTFEESGVVSGNGNLTVTGAGTLILSGSGSNGTGTTTLSSGVLSLRGTVSLGSGNLAFANGVLELGNGNFTRGLGTGPGQVNMNSATGGAGFAAFGADRTVNLGGGGATVTWGAGNFVASGQPLYLGSFIADHMLDFQNSINLNGAIRTITVTDGVGTGVDARISGVISGTGASGLIINSVGIAPWNPGTIVLSGINTYTGGTTIDAGTLSVSQDANLGATTGGLTINAGTLKVSATFSTIRLITLGNAASTLQVDPLQTYTVTSAIGGSGGLNKTGSGTLVLSGANTYTGTTTVNAGVLNIRNSAALGTTIAGTTVSTGAELQLQGGIAVGSEALTLNGTGVTNSGALHSISGNNSWAGNITIGSTSQIQSDAGLLTLSGILTNGGNGTAFDFDGAGNILVSGVITNNASIVKNGTGTLTLSGANTYTGTTTINAGTVMVNGSLNGTSGTALTFGGSGTFNSNEAAGRAQGMGALTFNSGDGTVQSTYGGSGNTSLTFASFTRAEGATANFVVSGGTNGTTNKIVLTGQPSGLIDAATFFNGSEYAYVDLTGFVRGINYGVDPGTVLSPGGVSLTGDNVKANGIISCQQSQRFETLHLSGNNNFNLCSNQTVTVDGILKSGNVPGGATITGGVGLMADLNTGMTIRTDRVNDSLTITTPIIANGTNSLTKSGAGTLTLSGANTYTGGTYVAGGTLQIGASERLLNTGALTVNGGTFGVQTFTETVGPVVLASGAITGSGTGTLVSSFYDVRSGSVSAILGGPASLAKNMEGTVTLTGANTYTGTTTVNDGQLVAAATSGSALGNTSALLVNADGNLVLGANNQINNTAPVTLAGGTLSTAGFDEGTTSSTGAGALNLAATGSTIDFGTGDTSTLAFALFNPGSYFLTIDNWTGTPGAMGDGTTDQLLFASDPTPYLGSFSFTGYDLGGFAVLLPSGFYEVTPDFTPVPEINPTVAAASVCLFGLLAMKTSRRRLQRLILRQRTK